MAEPAYRKVYQDLKTAIEQKKYKVGDILPTEPELEKAFGFSRTTIRKAIDMLAREGYISVRQGSGTRVLGRKAVQNLNAFSSISQSVAAKGFKVGLKSCFLEICLPDSKIASLLELGEGEKTLCIHRIKTAGKTPICLIKNFIPLSLVPDIKLDIKIPVLYDFLKENYGIEYTSSKDVISAQNATFEQASLLEIEPRSALLHVQRVCYRKGIPSEVDIVDMIADFYEYEIFLGEKIEG